MAMSEVANGAGVTGSTAGGVAEEEAVRDLFFLRYAFRIIGVVFRQDELVIHYPVFIHNRRKHERLACMSNGYHTCISS
jgi:hypothetical protein